MAPVLAELRGVARSVRGLEVESGAKSDRSEVGLFKVAELLGLSMGIKDWG